MMLPHDSMYGCVTAAVVLTSALFVLAQMLISSSL